MGRRAWHACASVDGRLLVVGGYNASGFGSPPLGDARVSEDGGVTWTAVTPPSTKGVAEAPLLATANGTLVVVSGTEATVGGPPAASSRLLVGVPTSWPGGWQWTSQSSNLPPRRQSLAALVGSGVVVVAGGMDDAGVVYADTWAATVDALHSWTMLKLPPSMGQRFRGCMFPVPGGFAVAGGRRAPSTYLGDTWTATVAGELDLGAGGPEFQVQQVNRSAWVRRSDHHCVGIDMSTLGGGVRSGPAVLMTDGTQGEGTYSHVPFIYDAERAEWQDSSTSDALYYPAVGFHAASTSPRGARVVSVGGVVAANLPANAESWALRPGSDFDFAPVSLSVAPGPRWGHQVVFAMDSFYLLAGATSTEGGGVPAADAWWALPLQEDEWTAVTTEAEFGPRALHAAVAAPDGSLFVLGGTPSVQLSEVLGGPAMQDSTAGAYADVWASHDRGASWTQKQVLAPDSSPVTLSAHIGSCAVYHHGLGAIVVVGGANASHAAMARTVTLTPSGSRDAGTLVARHGTAPWGPAFAASCGYLPTGQVFATGGRNAAGALATTLLWLSDDGLSWTSVQPNTEFQRSPGRYGAATAVLPSGTILLLGGVATSTGRAVGDVTLVKTVQEQTFRVDPVPELIMFDRAYAALLVLHEDDAVGAATAKVGVHVAAAAVKDPTALHTRLIVLGGERETPLGPVVKLRDVLLMTGRASGGFALGEAPWPARSRLGAVWVAAHQTACVFGGSGSGDSLLGDVWCNVSTLVGWEKRPLPPWEARSGPSVAALPRTSLVFLFGGVGEGGRVLGDAYISGDLCRSWQPLHQDGTTAPLLKPPPRFLASAHALARGDAVAVVGGSNGNRQPTADVWLAEISVGSVKGLKGPEFHVHWTNATPPGAVASPSRSVQFGDGSLCLIDDAASAMCSGPDLWEAASGAGAAAASWGRISLNATSLSLEGVPLPSIPDAGSVVSTPLRGTGGMASLGGSTSLAGRRTLVHLQRLQLFSPAPGQVIASGEALAVLWSGPSGADVARLDERGSAPSPRNWTLWHASNGSMPRLMPGAYVHLPTDLTPGNRYVLHVHLPTRGWLQSGTLFTGAAVQLDVEADAKGGTALRVATDRAVIVAGTALEVGVGAPAGRKAEVEIVGNGLPLSSAPRTSLGMFAAGKFRPAVPLDAVGGLAWAWARLRHHPAGNSTQLSPPLGAANAEAATHSTPTALYIACGAGWYRGPSGRCMPCPAGSFRAAPDGIGVDACTPCPPGTYGPQSGLAVLSQCVPCPVGTYSVGEGAAGPGACQPCPRGQYGTGVGLLTDTQACHPCPPGTYGASESGNVTTACVPCGRGTASPTQGAEDAVSCKVCPRGYFRDSVGGDKCAPCPLGTYGDDEGLITCKACPVGTYGGSGAAVSPDQCLACPLSNSVTPGPGAAAVVACVCDAGFLLVDGEGGASGEECRACPVGFSCKEAGNELPWVSLRPGYWRPGRTSVRSYSCAPTSACQGGALNTSSALDELCAPGHTGARCGSCRQGWYQLGGAGNPCQSCSSDVTRASDSILWLAGLGLCILLPCATHRLLRYRNSSFARSLKAGIQGGPPLSSKRPVARKSVAPLLRVPGTAPSASATEGGPRRGAAAATPVPKLFPLTSSDVDALRAERAAGQAQRRDSSPAATVHTRPGSTTHTLIMRGKTILPFLQISATLGTVYSIQWPPATSSVLQGLGIANFQVSESVPLACSFTHSFHSQLLYTTLSVPFVVALIMGSTLLLRWLYHSRNKVQRAGRGRLDPDALRTQRILRKLRSWLPLTVELAVQFCTVVYVPVTRVIFQTFSCERFDNGRAYLRADPRVDCSQSSHQRMVGYASVCCGLFVVGFPLVATLLLRARGDVGRGSRGRFRAATLNRTVQAAAAPLASAYRTGAPYAAVAELVRQSIRSGWLALLADAEAPSTTLRSTPYGQGAATGAQMVLALATCFAYATAYAYYRPMTDPVSNSVAFSAQVFLFVNFLLGLFTKVQSAGGTTSPSGALDAVTAALLVLQLVFLVTLAVSDFCCGKPPRQRVDGVHANQHKALVAARPNQVVPTDADAKQLPAEGAKALDPDVPPAPSAKQPPPDDTFEDEADLGSADWSNRGGIRKASSMQHRFGMYKRARSPVGRAPRQSQVFARNPMWAGGK